MSWHPLHQKLAIYDFAILEWEPLSQPQTMPEPLPQWFQSGSSQAWLFLKSRLPDYRPYSPNPVISPSLKALSRLRQVDPVRPLIWLRTPFERPPTVAMIRKLVHRDHPLAAALHERDLVEPLRLLSDRPRAHQILLRTGETIHPYRALQRLAGHYNPQTQLIIREDGRLLEQTHLSSPYQPWSLTKNQIQRMEAFDHQLGAILAQAPRGAYVCAQDPQDLAWFERDLIRLFGSRAIIRHNHQPTDNRDPLPCWMLISDTALRFQRLESGRPIVHLNGTPRLQQYRTQRYGPTGEVRLCEQRTILAAAVTSIKGKRFNLIKTNRGWESAHAPITAPDQSNDLDARLSRAKLLCA